MEATWGPCGNCGDMWPLEDLVEIRLRGHSTETTDLCFPCIEHAIRCDHAQGNRKWCAYCRKRWAEAEGRL